MKRFILLLCFVFWVGIAHADVDMFNGDVIAGSTDASGITYIGYTNTDGDAETPTGVIYGGTDIIMTSQWTADEAGTAKTIKAYVGLRSGTIDHESVTLWKDQDGTITLIGQGDYTGVNESWTGHITLVAESGEDLDFEIDDVLYFGGCASSNNTYKYGKDDSGGSGMYYTSGGDNSSGPPSTTTLTYSVNRLAGFILGYTP